MKQKKQKQKKCFLRKQKVVLVLIVVVERPGGEMCKARMEPPRSEQVQVSICSFPNSRIKTDADSGYSQNVACDWSWCCAADRQGRARFSEVFFGTFFLFHMGQ